MAMSTTTKTALVVGGLLMLGGRDERPRRAGAAPPPPPPEPPAPPDGGGAVEDQAEGAVAALQAANAARPPQGAIGTIGGVVPVGVVAGSAVSAPSIIERREADEQQALIAQRAAQAPPAPSPFSAADLKTHARRWMAQYRIKGKALWPGYTRAVQKAAKTLKVDGDYGPKTAGAMKWALGTFAPAPWAPPGPIVPYSPPV